MYSAKDIVVKPIDRKDADAAVKRWHYSGKVVNNSQLHIGVFLDGRLEGAMQFGPSLDKRKIVGLVSGTGWNEFIELNRMAFSDRLPRNSESRALAITFRMMRQFAPHIKWVISFADATQSGDGAIYRASGFVLTNIKVNDQIWEFPGGSVATILVATDTRRPQRQRLLDESNDAGARDSRTSMTAQGGKGAAAQKRVIMHALDTRSVTAPRQMSKIIANALSTRPSKGSPARSAGLLSRVTATKGNNILENGSASMKPFIEMGAKPLEGFQLRYIYFIDPTARERLTVPILPFSAIEEHKAGMYRGISISRAASADGGTPGIQPGGSGSSPTAALLDKAEA